MNVAMGNDRLVKAQVAGQPHDCSWCVDQIEPGERYMRVAIPPKPEVFPDIDKVVQEEAWKYVDRSWAIEKFHEICYHIRFNTPRP